MSAVIMIQDFAAAGKLSLPLPCAGCWQRQAGVLLLFVPKLLVLTP